jgi:hypothetical protein
VHFNNSLIAACRSICRNEGLWAGSGLVPGWDRNFRFRHHVNTSDDAPESCRGSVRPHFPPDCI